MTVIRSAVLEGSVDPSHRDAFDRAMRGPVLQAIASYPELQRVVLRQPVEHEDGAPAIHMIFDLHFASLDAMHRALASPTRQAVRAQLAQVMQGFKGRVYHLVLDEADTVVPGAQQAG